MKRLLLAALLLTNAMMANAIAAEPKASAPSEPHEITVREAVGLSFALRQLDGAASGASTKTAQRCSIRSVSTASRLWICDQPSRRRCRSGVYQKAKNIKIKELSNGGASVPSEKPGVFLEQNWTKCSTARLASWCGVSR